MVAIIGPVPFHMHLRIRSSMTTKIIAGVLLGITLNVHINLGWGF